MDSISNIDGIKSRGIRRSICVALFAVFGVVTFDVLINFLFAYPSDPKFLTPSSLQSYFEYGRSAEGQLARMSRPDPADTAPITLVGWYYPMEVTELPSKSNDNVVTFYGLSHAAMLGHALGRVSDQFTPRIISAPGATSNWAYGAYLRDLGGAKSRVVVLAFSSQTLPWITSMSPMTHFFDQTLPYTADRFVLEGDHLGVIHPPYESFRSFVDNFYDPVKWSGVRSFFSRNDPFYNSFMMRASPLDHSSLFRLARRAVGQQISARAGSVGKTGFAPKSEPVRVAAAIIHEFSVGARSHGMIPVIYLVNNLGYSDYLFRALSPALSADNVAYLSSHTVVSPDNPRAYVPNSHFTDENDDKLARALVAVIEREEQHLRGKTSQLNGGTLLTNPQR